MSEINVFLVDDHQLITDGLASLMQHAEGIRVVGSAENGKEALRLLSIVSVDVVLMDIDMPVMNGIEALKELRKNGSKVKVIILSMHREAGMIKNLMALGADGYMLKNTTHEELIAAIRKVAAGQSYFSADVTHSLLFQAASNPAEANPGTESLSERELEILKLIAEGFSNKEIGTILFISHRTVDTHRTNLMRKLNAKNIAALISYAIKAGIV